MDTHDTKRELIRYCDTAAGQFVPCEKHWSKTGPIKRYWQKCTDNPKERNCRNLVPKDA